MSDKPYPGDDAIMIAIYDYFGISMFDAERWFREIKTDEIRQYREALSSIAANTCCDKCREAALVAKDALSATTRRAGGA